MQMPPPVPPLPSDHLPWSDAKRNPFLPYFFTLPSIHPLTPPSPSRRLHFRSVVQISPSESTRYYLTVVQISPPPHHPWPRAKETLVFTDFILRFLPPPLRL